LIKLQLDELKEESDFLDMGEIFCGEAHFGAI
jgi:hypothetical protein